ncbi:tRNA lysidine(34) synthetase TilS [Rathayibacter sp. KR2-224]|uniref:tRNA lysidine(34) synthetase TilS n=1 Tax=Rathayibacter sp. KR2-224 TaxID=3400913 RepID=UPI003C06DB7D
MTDAQRRPRLTPPIADVRRAVRDALASAAVSAGDLVLVGLSGGADSLALAAGAAFEGLRAGIRVGAVIIDHGLQDASATTADRAREQAVALGLDPVVVKRVEVATPSGTGGPENAAREARYAAFAEVLADVGASHLLLAHTLDDQAETVLLGLARGSGAASLQGMAPESGSVLRPLLGIRRQATRQACIDAGLEPWDDPHNLDRSYTRVRVRHDVLPVLERELGPGVAEALARTAEQLREDARAFDEMIEEVIEDICEPAEAGIAVSVGALEANPPAVRNRIIRFVVLSEFGIALERVHVLAVARLVTEWHGQKRLDLPGVKVKRDGGMLVFTSSGA